MLKVLAWVAGLLVIVLIDAFKESFHSGGAGKGQTQP